MFKSVFKRSVGANRFFTCQSLTSAWGKRFSSQFEATPQSDENDIKNLQGLQEYRDALQLATEHRYTEAIKNLDRIVDILANSKMLVPRSHNHILKRKAMMYRLNDQHDEADECYETIVDNVENNTKNPVIIYSAYNDLFKQYVHSDVDKAISFGENLTDSDAIGDIPVIHHKDFYLNLANAYLLKGGECEKAKENLRKCLELELSPKYKGMVLNNLAVASWWHVLESDFHGDLKETPKDELYKFYAHQKNVKDDYELCLTQLKESIRNFEGIFPDDIFNIHKILDPANIIPDDVKQKDYTEKILLVNPLSGISISNICEILFQQKELDNFYFWLKYSLKFFEAVDQPNITRQLIFLGMVYAQNGQITSAEGIYRTCLGNLEKDNGFNKVFALQMYGSMLKNVEKRELEGLEYLNKAEQLQKKLPVWAERAVNLHVPDVEL